MEGESIEVVASSCTVLTTTVSSTSTPITQRTQTNHTDRQTVQVIQQAVHRPAGVAQYLQQMYAAQQHHIMLQTLHQHQQTTSPTTYSTASTQQVSQSNSRKATSPPPSANGSAAQTAITPPGSVVTQLQSPSISGSAGAISQQAVLLGNGSAPCSQAQMYLRTQMLILTPAASVAADLPALSSASSQPASTQVPSLALRTHLPGALSAAQSVQLKASQGQTLVTPLPRMSICPLKSTQLSQALAETSRTLSPALMRHQLHCPTSLKGVPPQFILQSSVAQRQVQPIALRVTDQDSSHPPLSLLTGTTPTPATVLSQHCEVVSCPASSDQPASQSSAQQHAVVASTSTVPSASPVLPDPPPLHLAPVVDPLCQAQPLSCPPPPPPLTLALPRLPATPSSASVQRLSLRSIHALAVRSDHMLLSEDELPVAEALAQLPFQNLPPPQTTAVDLKVQPNTNADKTSEDGAGVEMGREGEKCPDRSRTPTPPALTPTKNPQNSCRDTTQPEPRTGPLESSCLQSSRSVIRSAEDAVSTPPPPSLWPAVRSSRSSPTSASQRPPQAGVRPHILTHLIEGFVITEGLAPFPVGQTAAEKQQQVQLPEDRKLPENGAEHLDFLPDTEEPENSSDSDMDNTPAEDERSAVSPLDLLQCEFCGKRGSMRTFLRSKRFCSTTCIRSFNVSSTKRLAVLRAHRMTRWPNRPMGRRGRPPSRISRTHREHFFRQLQGSYRPDGAQQAFVSSRAGEDDCECEDPPGPMTTRLRLQAEREREREREQEGREREDCSSSTGLLDCSPALWSVDQVCSYISSLPGCLDMVAEFRSQEIDGQALLLLTEEHLMSAMNIKLGPALKICAHINSLKQP
ncbi:polyhomeotic-like protein 3 isoform X1 [Pygocentrus nattereri]|uniref:polyhomeotic-like protein 3 isoform X1 n=1 Tax=Pygocentrus nattereri TaxID=42514 RepID=UPI0008146948|nr:polyhomeotic-like protein 3 isoform X1 [Pygocentrus nattereri]XP_037402577.1 polyhomeotic-like protein 3 isoform X1 [Pygocentrus nattereri]